MTLHVFNPEHDLSLACNLTNFTPPAAARQLYADLCFIPALWAGDGDCVLVSDISYSRKAYCEFRGQFHDTIQGCVFPENNVDFVTESELSDLPITDIDVWGWNVNIRDRLLRCGVSEALLPEQEQIDIIRDLSHRKHVAGLLKHLRVGGTTGESFVCHTYNDVERLLVIYNNIVVKAPWSNSGRGIRFIMSEMTVHQSGWIKNMLKAQGSLIVEPYYNRVVDFGMEFRCDGEGHVIYDGLSLFQTDNWAYVGGIVASEEYKRNVLAGYVAPSLLDEVKEKISYYLGHLYAGRYRGAFGVDMMIVAGYGGSGFLLHPCVEINLRRTMGHVAIAIFALCGDRRGIMKIQRVQNKYQLKINSL